jgi:hypothetical protein
MMQAVSTSVTQSIPMRLHGTTFEKTVIFVLDTASASIIRVDVPLMMEAESLRNFGL